MLTIEANLTLVQAGDLSFQRVEISGGLIGTRARLRDLRRETIKLSRPRFEPFTGRMYLTGEADKSLTAISCRPHQRGQTLLLNSQRSFSRCPRRGGGSKVFPVCVNPAG